jgi:hypothetical protein
MVAVPDHTRRCFSQCRLFVRRIHILPHEQHKRYLSICVRWDVSRRQLNKLRLDKSSIILKHDAYNFDGNKLTRTT